MTQAQTSRILAAGTLFVALTLAGHARLNAEIVPGAQLARDIQAIVDSPTAEARLLAATLAQGMGLTGFTADQAAYPLAPQQVLPMPQGNAVGEVGNLQIALTQLAILAGANGQMSLIRAQNAQSEALIVRQGSVTLADLADQMASLETPVLIERDGVFYLDRPLVVWSDAGLTIGPGETLVLNRTAGAFLMSFGSLSIQQAAVRAEGAPNIGAPEFRPFVLVAGQGTLNATGSDFSDLGIATATLFGGLTVATPGLIRPEFPSAVIDNRFQDISRVSLIMADGGQMIGNQLQGSQGAIVVSGGQDVAVMSNDLHPGAASSGIRVTDGARGTVVAANIVIGGDKNGILIDRNVVGITLENNLLMQNGADGISLSRVNCARIRNNLVVQNRAVGVQLFDSAGVEVTGNGVLLNGVAGIDIQAKGQTGGTLVAQNVLARNGEGLRGTGIGQVTLQENALRDQLPRLFGGDFTAYLPGYLKVSEQDKGDTFVINAVVDAAGKSGATCQEGW